MIKRTAITAKKHITINEKMSSPGLPDGLHTYLHTKIPDLGIFWRALDC
jgi:hypothetical protein